MKFTQIREEYYIHTAKASDVMRQLTYAGLGVIWIFKAGSALPIVPRSMVPAALSFVLALVSDLLQYLVLAESWRRVAVQADKAVDAEEDEYGVPAATNVWGVRLYRSKAIFLGLGYAALIAAIVRLYWPG